MRSRPTRTISVGTTPVSIRKPALIGFGAQSFTAPTDVGANQVTVTSTAAYVTGLGCRLSLPNGGTMPTGLSASLLYFMIVVNATTLKFASSYDNALGNTPVSVSAVTGSGVVTITPASNDPDALPVTYATVRYPTGGQSIQLVTRSDAAYGDGIDVVAGSDFNDIDQSLQRYAVANGVGPTDVSITDWEE